MNMTKLQYILAFVVISGFIILTSLHFVPRVADVMPDWMKSNLNLITGSWIANFGVVVSYCFGSSKGSADKNEMIAKMKADSI